MLPNIESYIVMLLFLSMSVHMIVMLLFLSIPIHVTLFPWFFFYLFVYALFITNYVLKLLNLATNMGFF